MVKNPQPAVHPSLWQVGGESVERQLCISTNQTSWRRPVTLAAGLSFAARVDMVAWKCRAPLPQRWQVGFKRGVCSCLRQWCLPRASSIGNTVT